MHSVVLLSELVLQFQVLLLSGLQSHFILLVIFVQVLKFCKHTVLLSYSRQEVSVLCFIVVLFAAQGLHLLLQLLILSSKLHRKRIRRSLELDGRLLQP